MKPSNVVSSVVVSAVLVIAGCGGSSTKASSSTSSSTPATSTASSSVTTAPSTTVTAAAATLATAMNTTLGQQIIVEGTGKAVYLYAPDGANGTSQVPAGIKANWPAVTFASGAPTVGSGLDSSKVGTQAQPDGTKQVTYNGHLLYTFAGDAAPGDAKGQGLGSVWFTLSPAGDKNA